MRNVQQSICSILIHDEQLLGIVALDPGASAAIEWQALSPVAQRARKAAHEIGRASCRERVFRVV